MFLVVANLVWSAANTVLMSARLALFYAGIFRGNESPVNWLLDRCTKRGAGLHGANADVGAEKQTGSIFGTQKYVPDPEA